MLFLKLFLVAYLLCATITVVMVNAAIENKSFRRVFWFLGLVMPFIFAYAAFVAFFKRHTMVPFHAELAKIEDGIEAERVRIFGGEITCPSFSTRWEQAYKHSLERLLHTAAKAQEKIADFEMHLLKRAA